MTRSATRSPGQRVDAAAFRGQVDAIRLGQEAAARLERRRALERERAARDAEVERLAHAEIDRLLRQRSRFAAALGTEG